MVRSIWEDAKREFSYGNMVTRIIIINVAVFVLINLVRIVLFIGNGGEPSPLFQEIIRFFSMSSDWSHVLTHPWVIITSMFLHEGFFHILFNMLFIYWFGRIVADFIGNQRILPIYLLGGVAGAILYFVTANLLPYGQGGVSYALGASAGVMAIVVAAGAIAPDYIMRLLLLGDIKLKYIVAALVFLDLVAATGYTNTGGAFAHLGGALFGWVFIRQLQSGNDWAHPVNSFLDKVSNFFQGLGGSHSKKGPRVVYRNTSGRQRTDKASPDQSYQERLDTILDKIKQSGYESLSESEKEFLFNASKK